jgi:hypothetical protein
MKLKFSVSIQPYAISKKEISKNIWKEWVSGWYGIDKEHIMTMDYSKNPHVWSGYRDAHIVIIEVPEWYGFEWLLNNEIDRRTTRFIGVEE